MTNKPTFSMNKDNEIHGGTRRSKIWCSYRDGQYTPISLDSQYEPADDAKKAMASLGFELRQVESVIIIKLFPEEK